MLYPRVIRRVLLAITCALGLSAIAPQRAWGATASTHSIAATIVADARALLGASYAYIGDDPKTGFSCIGFVHYLYARAGINVPYNLTLAYAAGPHVPRTGLRPGDLVFFSNTVWRGLSHVALYAGDDQIIGADSFATGVEQTRLSDPYWTRHYTGATRPLASVTGATTPTPPPAPLPRRPLMRVGETLTWPTSVIVYSGPGVVYQTVARLAPGAALHVVHLQGVWANVWYRVGGIALFGWVDA